MSLETPLSWLLGGVGGFSVLLLLAAAYFIWKLRREIAIRRKVEQALREKTGELARSNKGLEEFAYVVSHDLQEPLRMVSNYCQLLEKRYRNRLDLDGRELLWYAADGAKRMQQLIKDLLIYYRVGASGHPVSTVDCQRVLDRVLKDLHLTIADAEAVVTRDSLPAVLGDEVQWAQLFHNLISNAIKFRREKPLRIHISARKEQGNWIFSVRDNGIGIAPEHAEQIFRVFQRLHSREEYPGTGIGLAICKRIVENYGGRIWVESQPGQGSVFFFSLPAAPERMR